MVALPRQGIYRTNAPIDQAKRNADWLATHLGKYTGEPVEVKPLVVLPGWFVRVSENVKTPVKVMNAKYLVNYLQDQNELIQPSQVQRIIARLDEKCRDLEF